MNKLRAFGVALVAAACVLASAAPAGAISTGGVTFVGTATVNPGLYYPLLGPGANGAWSISSNVCVGVEGSPKKTPPARAGTCTLNVSGQLGAGVVPGGAFCGSSGGSNGAGAATLTTPTLGTQSFSVSGVGWVTSAASLIVFTGRWSKPSTGNTGTIAGAVTAFPVPDPLGGSNSCLSGTATTFTVVGTANLLPV
jgi:hypothetical protein